MTATTRWLTLVCRRSRSSSWQAVVLAHQRALEEGLAIELRDVVRHVGDPPTTISADAGRRMQRRLINCSLRRSRSRALTHSSAGQRVLIALDGSSTSARARSNAAVLDAAARDGGTEYFHAFLGAAWSHRHKQVCTARSSLRARRRGGLRTQRASAGWPARCTVAHLRPVYLGDDLFACNRSSALSMMRRQLHPHLQAVFA